VVGSGDGASGHICEPIADRPLTLPHPDRLSLSHPARQEILDEHEDALRRGLATYTDPPTGLAVLTAEFLRSRGCCCHSGCRHCPYIE
jgi:hypothetical protein